MYLKPLINGIKQNISERRTMIVNQLAKLMAEKHLDCRDIVKMTGLDNHAVKKLYKAETSRITFETLDKLCFALECDTNDILKYQP